MKKISLTFLILFVAITAYSQNKFRQKLNLDFEVIKDRVPIGWNIFGDANYNTTIDSTIKKNGNYSTSIELKEGKPGYKTWSFIVPENYSGSKITLAGYIKTENVANGYTSIWMRIDPAIGYVDMSDNVVKGTTDWTKYEISLDMNPEKTKQIVIGGILTGTGKIWLDDFKISIDGKDIKDIPPIERKIYEAESDKEFDKGSNVGIISTDQNKTENLYKLGLIWGFLKYYHPNISKGKYNFDYELFRIMPKILKESNKANIDNILVEWINNFGDYTEYQTKDNVPNEPKYQPDLEWIYTSNFSNNLKKSLLKIKKADRNKDHYYIGLTSEVGNPVFKNEPAYFSMKYPDPGFRILSLYRYWNMIQYYFPYKNLIGENWNNILKEFIPKLIEAKNETEYTLYILEIIGRINDSHANIWGENESLNNYFGTNISPIRLAFIENKLVVTANKNNELISEPGLEIGDIITMIDKIPVEDIVKTRLKYYPASNYATKLRDISKNILRSNNNIIDVSFTRNKKEESKLIKTIKLNEINLNKQNTTEDTCFEFIKSNIAYIDNGKLKKEYLPEIWNKIEKTRGIIIDMRNYPSDFPLYEFSNYLLPSSTPFAKFSQGNIENPGLFSFTKPVNVGKENKNYYKGKVIILINDISQSSSEFHAMAYQVHPNATVVGSATAGADGNISQFYLPGGINTTISGIGVYYPDGKETQRVGIVPNIEVKPTIKGIMDGRDELIEKAIELINAQ